MVVTSLEKSTSKKQGEIWYQRKDVVSSSVQVWIMGTHAQPHAHPAARAPSLQPEVSPKKLTKRRKKSSFQSLTRPITKALSKLFVFSLRKFIRASCQRDSDLHKIKSLNAEKGGVTAIYSTSQMLQSNLKCENQIW